jgi:hypothetical protein
MPHTKQHDHNGDGSGNVSHAVLQDLGFSGSLHTGFQKETYATTSDPTANNDSADTAGIGVTFRAGDLWTNTSSKVIFACKDATPTAAVWSDISTSVGGGTVQGTDGTYDIQAANEGATAGNARGEYSVDLQTIRSSATQVASDESSVIAGGANNTSSKPSSTVGGGHTNAATSNYSTISGGQDNEAKVSSHTTVGGGNNNAASGQYATISGGNGNTAIGSPSNVAGGSNNTASGASTTVGGGSGNTAGSGSGATVGGGIGNTAVTSSTTVAGGNNNEITINGIYGFIGGGKENIVSSSYGNILGGQDNTVSASSGNVLGGSRNEVTATSATTLGGSYASAYLHGQLARSSGPRGTTKGSAQYSILNARIATTNANQTELFLDGASARAVLPASRAWTYSIKVSAYQYAGTAGTVGHAGMWKVEGGIVRDGSNSTRLVGTPTYTALGKDNAAWDVEVAADDSNEALLVKVTGEANKSIAWVASMELTEAG